MFKKKQQKILSLIMSFALILFNLSGLIGGQVVKAADGTGTSDNPYTVADVIANNNAPGVGVYASGYIVATSTGTAAWDLNLVAPFTVASNLGLADSPTETDKSKIIPIELKSGSLTRTALNLVDHPENLGKKVTVKGNLIAYFLQTGVKTLTAYEWVTVGDGTVTGVTLNKTTLDLGVGESSPLVATIAPSNATNKNVTWTVTTGGAITVATSGDITVTTAGAITITAVAEGTATITVTTEDQLKTSLCVVTVTANAPPVDKTFDIVEITDFHGQLLDSTNTKPVGAALAKVVKDVKAANPDRTLIIGGGDMYQGTPVSNVLRGVPVQKVLSNMGMEVTTLGNHEFDWGLDVINTETMIGANYSIVCANMYKKGTNDRPYPAYKIITKDGVKIAVIGAILQEAPTIIMPALVAPFDFKDPATEINTVAAELRAKTGADKIDIVLADVHDGGASLNVMVTKLHEVDAVFGGHTHSIADVVNKDADGKDVPTLIANSTGKGYIDLKITVDATTKALTFSAKGTNWKALTTTVDSPTDPDCKKIVDDASAALLPTFNEKIGTNATALNKDQLDSPYGESQLGNWMADVVKNYKASPSDLPADVGMVNNGGIRLSPIPAGDITVGTIFNLMPFDNTICSTTMTGAQLKFIFEQAVQTDGKGIQISGVKFTYDSSKPSYKAAVVAADGTITTPEVLGQRVQSIVRESDSSIVNATDTLKVNAPDFVATGGDTFTGFLVPEIVASLVDSHYTVRDALNADVRAKGKMTVEMNNRIDNQMVVVAPVAMTILEARTTTSIGVILTGYVSSVNGNNVFMQDNAAAPTAGICVYNTGGKTFTVKKGDKITVTGNLSTYSGLLEVTPTSAAGVVSVSTGNVITPKEVTVNQVTNAIQSQLVKVKNVKFTSIDNAGASMAEDSTGSINVYKMPVVAGLTVGDTADVTAAVTCYGTTIELAVDSAADVVKTGGSIPPAATISVVATSDVHGNVLNFDYGTNAAPSTAQGLAKVSTYVKGLRAVVNSNVMLIDNGDTIQGTPLVYYYNMIDKSAVYPMSAVMGEMGYDAMTLGNHEFNYGLDTLNRIMADGKAKNIHMLSANTYKTDGTNFVEPYIIKSFVVNGKTIDVAVLGLTTKTIPSWEDPAHYADLHFNDLVDEAKKWVPIVKAAGAEVIIVSAHTGEEGAADVIPENQAKALATQVSGIDAIVAGHAHSTLNDLTLKNPEGKVVPILEPGKWAQKVSQIDIAVDATGTVTGLATKNVTMGSTITEDPAITALIAPYQAKTLEYTATVLGQSTGEYKGDKQITEPTEIMELINKVQAGAAGTQLSIAAPLSLKAYIPIGNITIKDIMGVYVYENFLYGVKMNGKQIKDWMEYTVRYYKQTSSSTDPIVKDTALNIADYNLDQLYGASYDIDLTEPAGTIDPITKQMASGNRIKNLKFNGQLVKDSDVFTVAINNYRYNGGGGFMAAAGISNTDLSLVTYDSAKLLGDDGQVRSLMMKYVQDNKTITPSSTNNWKISTIDVAAATKISIIGTSDLHGAIYPLDYNTGLAANVGLAKVSTYVKGVRATNPNTMLIDNGDTIQGTPLSYYYDMIDTTSEYPMMKVMGAMGYDTWTLGNHEFNYGLTTLKRIISDATKENISVLSANTYNADDTNFVKPYIIKSFVVNGKTIKVGILGLTTKTVPSWEDPAHYAGLHFNDLVLEAQKWVPLMKTAGAVVVIASIHSGIKGASDTIPENQVDAVAQQVSGIDAILCGHTHTGKTYSYTNPDGKVIPVVQPKNGDGIFSQIDLNIDANGNYTGVTAFNVTLPANTVADPAILAIAQPYQDATLVYTNTVIGQSTAVFEGAKQLVEPSTIMELVNKVQANGAGTTLSIAAPLSLTAKVPQGDIKRQDIMGVYVYENFLFGLKMTGSQLKNWLEWSVRYYAQVANSTDPIVKDSVLKIADYNLDQLYGATYDIDLTQPACSVDSTGKVISGNRIKNLKINGVLVKDTDALKVAVNNYRYNGGGGFMAAAGFVPGSQATIDATLYDSAKTLGDDGQVRNMMFKYVQDNKTISPTNSNNWKISVIPIVVTPVSTGGTGGGGGSSTPVVTTPQTVVPVVTKTDSNSNVVATLDASKINKDTVNVIKIDEPKPESKIQVQIPASAIGTGTGRFVINTKAASLSIPTSIIDSSLLSSGGTLRVSQNVMPTADANALLVNISSGNKTNGKVFSFGMSVYDSNNNLVSAIHNFASGKSVGITINLSNDDIKGMDTSKISAFYFDVASKKWVEIGGSFDSAKMTFTFNTTHFTDFTIMQKADVFVNRLSGANRIETSIAIAKEQYTATKPDAVVLATANGFADALVGSGLAYKYNAPLLLVNKTVSDSKKVLDYITTNLSKNKNIYILGGTGVVSKEIADYLTVQGYKIIRLGGKDRYETNQKIVDYLNVAKGTSMVIATGNDFADALSISSIADIKGLPVLLNGKDNLSANASSYITKLQPTTIYVIGGTGVLSTNVENQIKKLSGNIEIVRLGGKDRYETSMRIVDYFNLSSTTITVATGKDFPDALSGSVLAARKKSAVLLVDNKNVSKQKELLTKQKITSVIVFGGEGVISKDIATSLIQK